MISNELNYPISLLFSFPFSRLSWSFTSSFWRLISHLRVIFGPRPVSKNWTRLISLKASHIMGFYTTALSSNAYSFMKHKRWHVSWRWVYMSTMACISFQFSQRFRKPFCLEEDRPLSSIPSKIKLKNQNAHK